jgi:hypothetical protein
MILSVFDIISLEALAICAPSLTYLSVSFSILKKYIKVKVVCFRGRKMTTALFFFFLFQEKNLLHLNQRSTATTFTTVVLMVNVPHKSIYQITNNKQVK